MKKRIIIATVQVPFIQGGAEAHARGLQQALQRAGHESEIVTMPFRFGPVREVRKSMCRWEEEDLACLNGYQPDAVICLRFPAYYLQHPEKRVWLLHQHREVYELWSKTLKAADPVEHGELKALQADIQAKDGEQLSRCPRLFANSKNVAARLWRFNGLRAEPLYHPPPLAERFYTAEAWPFIFCPGRLEGLKRQDLLIRAMQAVRSPVKAILSGAGSQADSYQRLIQDHGLEDRVLLPGRLSRAELLACYARCLAVFNGPFDEDYGYVSLEAMLARKPVITCTDSGGTLEFVEPGRTGFCIEPEPGRLTEAVEDLYADQKRARDMGRQGHARYRELEIGWERVVEKLVGGVEEVHGCR